MNQKYIWDTVSEYLRFLKSGSTHEDKNVKVLELTLDQLALAHHLAAPTAVEDGYPEAPAGDHGYYHTLASLRFPSFGGYPVGPRTPEPGGSPEVIDADALDDIAAIALDLEKVAWALENASESEAVRYFKHGFEARWGMRLRNLQRYVHAFRFPPR